MTSVSGITTVNTVLPTFRMQVKIFGLECPLVSKVCTDPLGVISSGFGGFMLGHEELFVVLIHYLAKSKGKKYRGPHSPTIFHSTITNRPK